MTKARKKPLWLILLLLLLLVFGFFKWIFPWLPPTVRDAPDIRLGMTRTDCWALFGPPTASWSDIRVWKDENWTLVCAFGWDENDVFGVTDFQLVDPYNRRIDGTIERTDTVWHVFQQSMFAPDEIRQRYIFEDGYGTLGAVCYDGGILLWSPSQASREVYDYGRIEEKYPYEIKGIWFFLIQQFFRLW